MLGHGWDGMICDGVGSYWMLWDDLGCFSTICDGLIWFGMLWDSWGWFLDDLGWFEIYLGMS